ncbi:MAG: hypothetical protein H0W87_08060 [Actinobacteria bacterium]|nr:hypothetical protein [Actinomycetota bacterium]
MMRPFSLISASFAAAALLAGCGGSSAPTTQSTPTQTTSAAANAAYERSYTDCGSIQLVDLAQKFHVKRNKDAVAIAVGRYWAKRARGGADAEAAGTEGCHAGFAAAGR